MSQASEDGKWLVGQSTDDRTMSSSVRNLLSAGSTPLHSLERKLADRLHKLQAAVIYGLEAEGALQIIKERLVNLEANASGRFVSASLEIVGEEEKENEAFIEQVGQLVSKLQEAKSRLELSEQVDEGSALKISVRKQSDSINSRLRTMEKVLLERKALIEKVKPLAEEFSMKEIELNSWLQHTGNEISLIDRAPAADETSMKERMIRMKVSLDFGQSAVFSMDLYAHISTHYFVLFITFFVISRSLFSMLTIVYCFSRFWLKTSRATKKTLTI